MLLSSNRHRLSTSSALATLLLAATAPAAFAAPSGGIVGLSADGATMLVSTVDSSTGDLSYTFTDVATGSTQALPAPSGYTDPTINALSADGNAAAGYYGNSNGYMAFVWTAADGYVDLGKIGGRSTYAEAVSADGTAAAGWGSTDNFNDAGAFYWTKANGIQSLGTLGGDDSYAWGISADGTTVVGESERLSDTYSHAFVWTAATGMQNIDTIFESSQAKLASTDGSVVVGTGVETTVLAPTTLFRWTSAGGIEDLGNLGGLSIKAAAMSDDGSVIVGSADNTSHYNHAYRYAVGSGISDLGTLGGNSSSASDVSADGGVVVGTASDSSAVNHGFRWTQATGMQTVEDWLAGQGISLGGVTTKSADFVSANGNVVVGETADNTTYIARVATPATSSGDTSTTGDSTTTGNSTTGDSSAGGTGIIDTSKFFPTVAATNNVAVQNGIYGADTIMFGAQGEPMRNLLATGQRSVWGTIDGGYDDGDNSKGGIGLGEFGFGYGIADGVTTRFSAGGTYTKQDLDAGGDVRQRGFYLSPEVSADVGHNVYLTVGGYWGRGSIDSHRAYQNGSDLDYSDGSTNSQTWGSKIRLDWLNAATINNTAITPYAALSYTHTRLNGFTEDSGSFPISYDATDDHATIARLGSDFVHPLTGSMRLLAKAEADYQFEGHSADTRGTLVGISDFDLAGQAQKHFWLRGGLGAEFDLGKGTASVMVNATTQGQDPDFWVRTNFTVKF